MRSPSLTIISALPPPMSVIMMRWPALGHALHHAHVNQASLFESRDHFHRRPQYGARAFQKLGAIGGVPESGRAHRADSDHLSRAVFGGHLSEHGAGRINRLLAHPAMAENALAQTNHLARRSQCFMGSPGCTSAASIRIELLPISTAA